MKKKAKRRPAARSALPTLRKLSPQLNALLRLGLPAVRDLALAARAERLTRRAEIEEISRRAVAEGDPDRRLDLERQLDEVIERIPHSLVHGVYFPTDESLKDDAPVRFKEPYVSVLIKSQCAYVDLERLGVRVRAQAHDIFSAFVPWGLLEDLAQMPGIDFVELARPMRSALSASLPYSQITNLKAGGLTGAGVIVGVVDSSFLFFYHQDFRHPPPDVVGGDGLGSTRVLFIWDQALEPDRNESGPSGIFGFSPGTGSTYGVEYSKPDIDTDLTNFQPAAAQLPIKLAYQTVRHQTDIVGGNTAHGTHVCGIAAGNGRAPPPTPGNFAGAAPKADIIYVCNIAKNTWHADSTTVTDAFAYIFARASELDQPCVINMSQGDNVGPHDGTSLVEQFLDKLLLEPGRAITVAAGNATAAEEHARGRVAPGVTTPVILRFHSNPANNESAEIWYDGHDVFDVTLKIPTNPQTVIGPVAPGASSPVVQLASGVKVQIVHTLKDPRNGDNVISLFISDVDAAHTIQNGPWRFELTGTSVINGAFEAWVDINNRDKHWWDPPTSAESTIAVPASGVRVIAVGAHDRTSPLPSIYFKSGLGPSRDDRIKPDITAVGVSVTSTWLRLINAAAPGPFYSTIGGTSMAAPMVAGTAALLFECRGATLTSSDVKQLLQNAAGMPADGIPSPPFGWGFLQAANLCAAPLPAVDVWMRDELNDNGTEPFTGPVNWLSPDIEVLDLDGNLVSNPTHDPANLINNLVRVTVRNRGTQTARNVEVYLYWGDPATNLPFPGQWRATGIYTGNPDPNFVVQSNKIVVHQLAAGATTTVRFGWAPPAPGSNIPGDDHFCLIARLEHEDDASNVSTGGWSAIHGSNNVATRNIHVQELTGGAADTVLYVTGSGDHDALELETEKLNGRVEVVFPVLALPWRDLTMLNRTGPRGAFGTERSGDPLAERNEVIKAKEAALRTGINGLTELRFAGGNVHLIAAAGSRLDIPEIRVDAGARMPVRLLVRRAKIGSSSGFVHVRQRSGGKVTGGVTLELTKKLVRAKPIPARFEGGMLVPPLQHVDDVQ